VDSSALVKIIIEEDESEALRRAIEEIGMALVTSQIAEVEVTRAVKIANPDQIGECERLLASCTRVRVSESIIRRATMLASAHLRTLDAIHLATALRADASSMVVYDERLSAVAGAAGLTVLHPGLP
jgi:uncharacterized protein